MHFIVWQSFKVSLFFYSLFFLIEQSNVKVCAQKFIIFGKVFLKTYIEDIQINFDIPFHTKIIVKFNIHEASIKKEKSYISIKFVAKGKWSA